MTDDRMTGPELRARREYLGLTTEALAARLGVRHDTVRRWESGRVAIPVRVPDELAAVEAETVEAVEDVADILRQSLSEQLADGWAMHVLDDRGQPAIRAYGPRWWRHVVVRAAAEVPGADVSGLLVWPAHWKSWQAD